jgi:hypothetical protein
MFSVGRKYTATIHWFQKQLYAMSCSTLFSSIKNNHHMIEVFKTSVSNSIDAEEAINVLKKIFPASNINFDLNDCDNILRIEGHDFVAGDVIKTLQLLQHDCEILI